VTKSACVVLVVLAGGCGSPSGPDAESALPVVAGTWLGHVRETGCTSDCCRPSCSARFKGTQPHWDLHLTLTQRGSKVSGRFEQVPRGGEAPESGQVSGLLRPSGLVELSGILTWRSDTFPDVAGASQIRDFNVVLDSSGTSMRGGFLMVRLMEDGREFIRLSCEVQLERTP
jgi:hypothetical protein